MSGDFGGTDRFEVLSRLGRGGMGVVYEVFDRERKARVALKKLRTPTPEGLVRFKNEFRALEDVQHPNLVMLGELIEDGGDWFFTMELVDGVDFLEFVRPEGRLDVERLTAALRQLAGAVSALHAAGKVHRDIKPSNIVVEPGGRLALLDLGLVLDLDDDTVPARDCLAGTASYMAPEQAVAAGSVGPEADWYSVGVVLYQALTGRLPFEGPGLAVMEAKQERMPVPADGIADGLPRELVDLATGLLATAPDDRPGDGHVMRALGVTAEGSHPTASSPGAPFVGRRAELDALFEAYYAALAQPVTVLVEGQSGVGKTALVQRFVERLTAVTPHGQRPMVLYGRCHERETVPYKAVDDIVDGLSRHLLRMPRDTVEALLPPDVRLLARVFPVLRRVEAIAVAPGTATEAAEDRERRVQVFAAFRDLFRVLTARRPVVLIIDDLQWADADSAALLRELMREPDAPRLLLLATVRTGGDAPAAFDLPGQVRAVALGGLPRDDALALARFLAEQAGAPASDDVLARAATDEVGGHPLFIAELVRYARTHPGRPFDSLRLEEALWSRVRALPAPVRRLLSLIALSGEPLTQEVAARAGEAVDFNEYARWANTLRRAFLVRTTGVRARDRVEPYHDRVRAAVTAQLAPEARAVCHRRLAIALEGADHADPEALAYHWRGAGDIAAAASHALDAARRADDAYAFDHAARLYRLALELSAPVGEARGELLAHLGDALTNAGRGRAAGDVYLDAADESHQSIALELRRRAAEQYLRAGHIADGMRVLDQVLEPIGMKLAPTPRRALVSLALTRARVRVRGLGFRRRDERDIPREALIRIDTCWAVSIGLTLVDPIRASDFQARQLLLALRLGEPYRVCRALTAEAGYRSTAGGNRRQPRINAIFEQCRELAIELDDPRALAITTLSHALSSYLFGRWREARDLCREALVPINQSVGLGWELFNARYFQLLADYWLGDLRGFARAIPIIVADADERGDLLAGTTLRNGLVAMAPLLFDQPGRAREESIEVVSRLPEGFNFQHYWQMIALANCGVYEGNVEAALAALDASWDQSARAMLYRIQYIRTEAFWTRARVHLAAAARRDGSERERHLREAARCGRKLAGTRMFWIDPKAALVAAGVSMLRGDGAGAVAELERAAAAFDGAEMSALATAARRARGQVVGGAAGAAMVDDADAWLREQGVVAPARLAALWVPGCASAGA